MKKTLIVLLVCGVGLWAADFWQKPSSDWTDKEVQKLLTNSPWAHSMSVSMNGPSTANAIQSAAGNSGVDPVQQPISEGGGGGRGRGGSSSAAAAAAAAAAGDGPSMNVVIRWQNAKPIKQALVKAKYGAEAATSAEAKQLLDREEMSYIIVVSGPLRALMRGDPESVKKALMEQTSLSVKGKGTLKPTEVQLGGAEKNVDTYFYFPRSAAMTLDDKEVDFATRIGTMELKNRFRFKDMVIAGKLEI